MSAYTEATGVCRECNETKPIDDGFYRHRGSYIKTCRACICQRAIETRKLARELSGRPTVKITKESDLTPEILNKALIYHKESGTFLRRWDVPSVKAGSPAGYVADSGYIIISVCGREFRAHRLVWLLEHGEFPCRTLVIDHINRNPSDNRIENLRAVPQKINAQNIVKPKRNNTSGYLGVRPYKGRYTARIYNPEGREYQIGTFDTPEQAHAAYVEKKKQFYPEAVIA